MPKQISHELMQYYEAQFTMMASKGWKDMCEDFKAIVANLNDITTATPENLLNRQGRIAELNIILNRRDTLSRAYLELTDAP